LILFSCATHVATEKSLQLQNRIAEKNFIFRAQTALPAGGQAVNLTSEYDLRIKGDSVIGFLPYFGRAFTASYNEEGGIRFTSTANEFSVQQKKKGGWEINVLPKGANDVRQLYLSVSPEGYSTLQVMLVNRQPISFQGIIM